MHSTQLADPFHRWNPGKRQRIRDLPSADRPREKLLRNGAASLSDVELLAVLLGSGTRRIGVLDLASRILRTFNGHLDQADVVELQSIVGVGKAKACLIGSALELARRHVSKGKHAIREAADALPYLQSIRGRKQEHFVCISMNGANEVIESRIVTVGLLDTNQVHPREVFADPISDRAASILVAHNHPSGALNPSPEDLALTRRIVHAGDLLGIRVLDHLIVTADGFVSLREAGHI